MNTAVTIICFVNLIISIILGAGFSASAGWFCAFSGWLLLTIEEV